MKKILAMMLTAAMMLSMSAAVMADETTYTDEATVTITKVYKETNEGTTSPAETFEFTVAEGWEGKYVTDSTVADTADAVKASYKEGTKIEIDDVTYEAGDATVDGAEKPVLITLPEYTVVGIYYYTITETKADTAGVTYYTTPIMLKVTVVEQDGKVRVAAVHTEEGYNGTEADGTKKDKFENLYSAGSLAVSKTVTGILGDKTKDFTVRVVFTAPAGKTVREAITYTDDNETKTIAANWTGSTDEIVIDLKDGETVTFTNIPTDVTYTVVEDSYASEEYDAAKYVNSDNATTDTGAGTISLTETTKTIDGKEVTVKVADADTVAITNNKGGNVDTGISVDSIPYIAMLGVVAIGGAGFMVSKKRRSED